MKKGSPGEGRGLTRVFEEEVQTNLVLRKKKKKSETEKKDLVVKNISNLVQI